MFERLTRQSLHPDGNLRTDASTSMLDRFSQTDDLEPVSYPQGRSRSRSYSSQKTATQIQQLTTSSTSDDTLKTANNWGWVIGQVVPQGTTATCYAPLNNVSGIDRVDYHQFTLATSSNITLSLSRLTAQVNLELISDINNNGVVDKGDVVIRSERSTENRSINLSGLYGTYHLKVESHDQINTNYQVGLTAIAGYGKEGTDSNTPVNARQIEGFLVGHRKFTGSLNATTDVVDFYRFDVEQSAQFIAELTPGSSDVDLALFYDANKNAVLDSGELIASSAQPNLYGETIVPEKLQSGTYYLMAATSSATSGSTTYNIELEAAPNVRSEVRVNIDELAALAMFDSPFWGIYGYQADFRGTVTINGVQQTFGTFQNQNVVQGLEFTQAVDPNQRYISVGISAWDVDSTTTNQGDFADLNSSPTSAGLSFLVDSFTGEVFYGSAKYYEGQTMQFIGDGSSPAGMTAKRAGIKLRIDWLGSMR